MQHAACLPRGHNDGSDVLCMQPVTAIVHIAAAQRLAVLCDGALLLLDDESLQEYSLPAIKVLRHRVPSAHLDVHQLLPVVL